MKEQTFLKIDMKIHSRFWSVFGISFLIFYFSWHHWWLTWKSWYLTTKEDVKFLEGLESEFTLDLNLASVSLLSWPFFFFFLRWVVIYISSDPFHWSILSYRNLGIIIVKRMSQEKELLEYGKIWKPGKY